jgi:Spy/CpxP family protein refolding chaperone
MANGSSGTAPSRTRGFLLLSVVFLLGVVCGGAVVFIGIRTIPSEGLRRSGPEPGPGGGHMVQLARDLDLDEEQKERIGEILDESRTGIHAIMDESRDRIREILRPEQREIFDQMGTRRRRGPGRRGPGRGGRRGPPPDDPPPPPPED